jgi:hypothetical protein
MKKILTLLILIAYYQDGISQKDTTSDQLTVINILGAKVYAQPNFDSKTSTELKVGEKIVVEKIIPSNDQIEIGNGFALSGDWIKPMEISGFVFSSDLTDKNAEIGPNKYGQINVDLKGNLIDEKEEEKKIKTENGVFPKYFEYKYYVNGTYTYKSWDGCFDHITEYKNLTISEVYHQMVSDYGINMSDINGTSFWIPIFKEKSGNFIKFEGEGATQDLKIELKENGNIIVSSYDCT